MPFSDDELIRDSPIHYEKNEMMFRTEKKNFDHDLLKELKKLHLLLIESSEYIIKVQKMMKNKCTEKQCGKLKLAIKKIISENNFKTLQKDEEKIINLILKKIKISTEITRKLINLDKLTHILYLLEKTFIHFKEIRKSLDDIFSKLQKKNINIIEQVRGINVKHNLRFSDQFISELLKSNIVYKF